MDLDLATLGDFATALLIGAMIGIEREKRAFADPDHISIGGLRTFILVAALGALGGWFAIEFQQIAFVAGAIVIVTAMVLTGYVLSAVGAHHLPAAVGLTTEVAAIVVSLLASMVMLRHRELAVALAVVTAAVLAYKQPLHSMVERLGWDDVFAGLRLLLATFVVLPLLPDHAIDPWGALNPRTLWMLVLLISGLSLVGYIATRWLGPRRGSTITALTGALVSSTAVTLAFARLSRDHASTARVRMLAGGILLAWGVMFTRMLLLVLVVNQSLVAALVAPFAAMAAIAAGAAWWLLRATAAHAADHDKVELRNPFSLTEAAKFAAYFAVVLLVVKGVQIYYPGEGMYLVAALAGLTDVDAITLSMAGFAKTGDATVAVYAITLAALSNTVVKAAMVVTLGSPALRRPLLIAAGAVLFAGIGTLLLV